MNYNMLMTTSYDFLRPKDLEAELAKASRRRSLRDTSDILSWGDDSMDTMELCRLLQERDAKDDQKRKIGLHAKDIIPKYVLDYLNVLHYGSHNFILITISYLIYQANTGRKLFWNCAGNI